MNSLDILQPFFTLPEKTGSKHSFTEPSIRITFQEADAILYGIPLDITTSFNRGTSFGPEAIRRTSAEQIESFILDEDKEIFETIKIFDLGDLQMDKSFKDVKQIDSIFKKTSKSIDKINSTIRKDKKIPIIIGGEHTLSYFTIKSIASENPVIIHFDAHRDMKSIYEGLKLCHTTPFYHLINDGYINGKDIIQIGIRQTDHEENEFAKQKFVKTFNAWDIYYNIKEVKKEIKKITNNQKIYISFDIDVYDICYVPCTGTPEPFGLNPFQILELISSIHKTSELIGVDLVEVGLKNNDYREGTLATQTLYRILSKLGKRI